MEDLKGTFDRDDIINKLYKEQLSNRIYLIAIISFIKVLDDQRLKTDFVQLPSGYFFELFHSLLEPSLQFVSDHDPTISEALHQMVKKEFGDLPGFDFH